MFPWRRMIFGRCGCSRRKCRQVKVVLPCIASACIVTILMRALTSELDQTNSKYSDGPIRPIQVEPSRSAGDESRTSTNKIRIQLAETESHVPVNLDTHSTPTQFKLPRFNSSAPRQERTKALLKDKDNFELRQLAALHPAFQRKVVGANKTILLDLAKAFDALVHGKLNLTYLMYGGSLLGSFRHHDLIPWDDDIDLLANYSNKRQIFAALEHLYPKYEVFEAGPRLKFFSRHSRRTSRYPWGWPYVDIHFFRENLTHIWDSSKEFDEYIYNKSIVFPLHRRPFGGLHLNAPRDSFANLIETYNSKDCVALPYSHEFERPGQKNLTRTPCRTLRAVYPFVHRSSAENGVRETLMIGDTKLYSMVVGEPGYAVTQPFSLQLVMNEDALL